MGNVEFKDNSMKIIADINDRTIQWLYESGGEVKSRAIRNSRVDQSQLKGSWKCIVDESELEATIGSELENAIWEEFGTGIHAENNDGRSGYWIFVKNGDVHTQSPKSYTLEEAKKIMAIMRSKGLEAFYTQGKKPNHTLFRAIDPIKSKIEKRLEKILKG